MCSYKRNPPILFLLPMISMNSNNSSQPDVSNKNTASSGTINTRIFYDEYKGHPVKLLKLLIDKQPQTPTIYLAGDSTLDNKYWIPYFTATHPDSTHAKLFHDNHIKRDVSYWLNKSCSQVGLRAINCAVEESTLSERYNRLLAQDILIRDTIREQDTLVICVGGNDVARLLKPALILDVLWAVYLGGQLGRSLKNIFYDDMKRYITNLIEKTKPRLVVVCSLYFPDETRNPSWASSILALLGYNSRPDRLQGAIKKVFEQGIKQVVMDDVNVIHVPFYEVLDGKNSELYVARAEPSEKGAQLMADLLKERILEAFSKNETFDNTNRT